MSKQIDLSEKLRAKISAYVQKDPRKKNIDEGLSLLNKSGYKPEVYAILSANKNRQDVPKKIDTILREYLRYKFTPEAKIVENTDINAGNTTIVEDVNDPTLELMKTFNNVIEKVGKKFEEFPVNVQKAITQYRELYTMRSILHNELKGIGEKNDEESTAIRQKISDKILAISQKLESLFTAFETYVSKNEDISDETVIELNFEYITKESDDDAEKKEFVVATTVEDLQKQKENWRIKILKAENQLLYQSDKKLDVENKMPEGPKRIKKEKQLEKLLAEKSIIDTELAKLG